MKTAKAIKITDLAKKIGVSTTSVSRALNGLIFHSQVSYIIPIFGIILGYIFLNEIITSKIVVALIAVFIGIYLARKADYKNVT